METIELTYPAKRRISKPAHIGVVGSGDLEVLLEPAAEMTTQIRICTSVDGFSTTWRAVLDRFAAGYDGVARIEINDAGATPGVVSLRLAQAVEASEK